MPIGPIPQNIANLVDTQAYKAGDNNAVATSGGKGLFTLKSTQARKNQAVLTNVVNQLKAAFGNNSFSPSALSLPPDVAKGKRAITGADIKALATTARQLAATQQTVRNLSTVLSNANATAGEIMTVLKNATQGFPADQQSAIVKQGIGLLSNRQQASLRALVMSPGMRDISSIMKCAGSLLPKAMTGHQHVTNAAANVNNLLGALVDGVRTAQAGTLQGLPQGQMLQNILPEDFSFQGGPNLFSNLSNELKTTCTNLGLNIQAFQDDIRADIDNKVTGADKGTIIRGDSVGTSALRFAYKDNVLSCLRGIIEPMMQSVTPQMRAEALQLDPDRGLRNKTVRNQMLDTPAGRHFQQQLAAKMTQNPLKSQLENVIQMLRNEVKPHVGTALHAEKLLSSFAAAAFLQPSLALGLGIDSTAEPEKFETVLLIQQALNMRLRSPGTNQDGTQRPADVMYTALTQLQGFNQLIAPPQNNIEI